MLIWKDHQPELPPVAVVFLVSDGAIEHVPSPLIHYVGERKEGDLLQRHSVQEIDGRLGRIAAGWLVE